MGGGMNYNVLGNAQKAATYSAYLSQLNGATGNNSPLWISTSKTLSDNQITVAVINGIDSSGDTALRVTATKVMPLYIGQVFTSPGNVTIIAELVPAVPAGGGGGRPCLVALGTTGTNITLTGSAAISGATCNVRSDASISLSGAAAISAAATYVAGSVALSGSAKVTGSE